MQKRSKVQDGIFLAAGIYLIYVAYQLFRDMPETSGGTRVALTIAAIVFIVVGVWVGIRSVRAFLPGNQQDESDQDGEKEADAQSQERDTQKIEDPDKEEIEDQTAGPGDTEPEAGSEEPEEEPEESEEEPEEPEEEPEESEEEPDAKDEKESEKQ